MEKEKHPFLSDAYFGEKFSGYDGEHAPNDHPYYMEKKNLKDNWKEVLFVILVGISGLILFY